MKVLMYGWEFPPNISGGLGIASHGIVQGLLDNQIKVALVLPGSGMPVSLFPDAIGLQIIQTPFLHAMIGPYSGDQLHPDQHSFATIAPSIDNHDLLPHDLLSAVKQYVIAAGSFAKTIPQ